MALLIRFILVLAFIISFANSSIATESQGKGVQTRDSWIDEDFTSTNYGTSTDAEIGNRTGGAGEKIFWLACVDIRETVDAVSPGNAQEVDSVRIQIYIENSANNVVVNMRECLLVTVETEIV